MKLKEEGGKEGKEGGRVSWSEGREGTTRSHTSFVQRDGVNVQVARNPEHVRREMDADRPGLVCLVELDQRRADCQGCQGGSLGT